MNEIKNLYKKIPKIKPTINKKILVKHDFITAPND